MSFYASRKAYKEPIWIRLRIEVRPNHIKLVADDECRGKVSNWDITIILKLRVMKLKLEEKKRKQENFK